MKKVLTPFIAIGASPFYGDNHRNPVVGLPYYFAHKM